ncbi:nucleotidyltransferase family protein [Porticoccus sp. GXU_MW_L64]
MSQNNAPTVATVLLAAGLSSRMGELNKLLLPVDGKPMVRHMANIYLQAGVAELVVVVGYQQQKVRNALSGLPVTIVENPEYENGQLSSIQQGLQAVSNAADFVCVALSDQPLLTSDDVRHLVDAFSALQAQPKNTKTMLVPYVGGKRGNPILLTRQQALAADKQGVRLGCRKLIDKYPEKVVCLEVDHTRYHKDVDTQQDAKTTLNLHALREAG